MASAVSALSSGTSTTSAASVGASAPTEQVFLQLLVSQIKNQDPLNPTDSTQFVAQLAQFSELEQMIGIRSDIEKGAAVNAPPQPVAPVQTSIPTPASIASNSNQQQLS